MASPYAVQRLPFLVNAAGVPVGVKQMNGDEVLFARFSSDMTSLMRPDGSMVLMKELTQVQADWTATDGLGMILNKPDPAAPALAARSLNTVFQVSASRNALVFYSVQITCSSTIAAGQNGDVVLETATNAAFTTGVQTLALVGNGQTYSLAAALAGVQPLTQVLTAFIPAGCYARLRTVNNLGTPTFAFRSGQEVLM